jgi:hypothetical protein
MRSITRKVAIVLSGALLSTAVVSPTLAASPKPIASQFRIEGAQTPQSQLLKSTPNGNIYLLKYPVTSIGGGAVGSAATAVATLCWTITWSVLGKDVFGFLVWQYNHKTEWCSADGKKTVQATPQVVRWGSTPGPGWGYEASGAVQTWWGTGKKTFRSFSQGHMGLCIFVLGCQNVYPWIDQTVHPNGTVSGDAGT